MTWNEAQSSAGSAAHYVWMQHGAHTSLMFAHQAELRGKSAQICRESLQCEIFCLNSECLLHHECVQGMQGEEYYGKSIGGANVRKAVFHFGWENHHSST